MKLSLRPVRDTDLPVLFEQQRDEEANAMAAFGPRDPHDRAAFDTHWQRALASASTLVRTIEVEGQIAGSIVRWRDESLDAPEVSYWLGRDHWGRGVATAALRAFLEEIDDPRLYGRVAHTNPASLRVLQKCGFALVDVQHGVTATDGRQVTEYIARLDR